MSEVESLQDALARSRVAPDYTMGALAQRTGVPPDTLRSWERRYGFPTPVRTDTNRRLYSERDIVAVGWLRDQTERGQGISEAIAMLRSRMPGSDTDHTTDEVVRVAPPPALPLEKLKKRLLSGDLAGSQTLWDELVIALSPEGIGHVLLELHRTLQEQPHADRAHETDRAHAFLLRKAMVLLDHAGPDRGRSVLGLVTSGTHDAELPATVLAATLARSGFRVTTPFPAITSLKAVEAVHHSHPEGVILVGVTDDQAASFSRLIPGVDIHRWNPADSESETSSLSAVVERLHHNN
jgi:DNA-binding transcriptional MerR regulator